VLSSDDGGDDEDVPRWPDARSLVHRSVGANLPSGPFGPIGRRPEATGTIPPSARPPIGRTSARPDAMKPDIQGVLTHWIRGFMACPKGRSAWNVVLMVSV